MKKMKSAKMKNKFSLFNFIVMLVLIVYSLTIIFSIYFVLTTSFKTNRGFTENIFGLPTKKIFQNNILPILKQPIQVNRNGGEEPIKIFPHVFVYTALYTVGSAFFATAVPCFTAYFAAKFDYKFSNFLVAMVIAVMIIPIVGNIPATINMLESLNIYGTIFSAWIMKGNFVNMWFLVFHAAFKGVPKDYTEAAQIDGASEFRVMFQIVLPLVRTTFFTVILIFFVDLWNDYQTPLLFTPGYPTLANVVYKYAQGTMGKEYVKAVYKMAACTLMIVPTLVIFVAFRKKLMGNLTMGGIKG